ncbi:MAG: ABC transporter ATP-binding protein, partial [Acidobacteriota bacterium]
LMLGRSTVLISHRLMDMDDMNEILVLDRGLVVERGTHKTLLRLRGLYWQLYEAQQLELGEDGSHEF